MADIIKANIRFTNKNIFRNYHFDGHIWIFETALSYFNILLCFAFVNATRKMENFGKFNFISK